MNAVWLLLQLVFGFAVVLAPGALLARALGVRGAAAALAWALVLVFASLAVTFAVSASLDVTLVLLLASGLVALPGPIGYVSGPIDPSSDPRLESREHPRPVRLWFCRGDSTRVRLA